MSINTSNFSLSQPSRRRWQESTRESKDLTTLNHSNLLKMETFSVAVAVAVALMCAFSRALPHLLRLQTVLNSCNVLLLHEFVVKMLRSVFFLYRYENCKSYKRLWALTVQLLNIRRYQLTHGWWVYFNKWMKTVIVRSLKCREMFKINCALTTFHKIRNNEVTCSWR